MPYGRAGALLALSTLAFAAACGLELSGTLVAGESDGGALDASMGLDAAADAIVGSDAAPPDAYADAAIDAAVDAIEEPEAAPPPPCDGLRCGTGCLVATTSCVSCDAGALLCSSSSSCVGDCTACATGPIECYACDQNRQNPVGSCQPDNPSGYCLNGIYGGDNLHCSCTTAADCPSPDEVCIPHDPGSIIYPGNGCYTCGEKDSSHDTSGQTCGTGHACNTDAAVPSCQ